MDIFIIDMDWISAGEAETADMVRSAGSFDRPCNAIRCRQCKWKLPELISNVREKTNDERICCSFMYR